MDPKQAKVVLGMTFLVVLLWLAFPLLGRQEAPRIPSPQPQLFFEPARALQNTREYVTRHPRRVLGSIESRQSTGFLQQRFQQLGYGVTYSHFEAILAGRRQVGRNVYAFKPSQSPEILVLMAHYDTARTTFEGAMDNGSGVGVLLELARIFAAAALRRGLLLVATDGEEWGMLGAIDFADNHPDRSRVMAALSLDCVAAGDLDRFNLDTAGQMRGYTPPWLRALAQTAVEAEGMPVFQPGGFLEFLDRALLISLTDQGPLLQAGIPAINLGSESRDPAREQAIYHSPEDVTGNLKVESMERYGRAAERIIRTLDGLPSAPVQPSGAFRVLGNRMLAPPLMTIFQVLAFLPLFLTLAFHIVNHRAYVSPGRIQRELSCFFGTLLPMILVYPIILALSMLGRIPSYSGYPATPKDPVLNQPQWGVIEGIVGTSILAAVGCYFLIRFLNRKLPRADFFVSKAVLLALLCVIVVGALLYNAYWAVSFLVLPAWLWALVGPGEGPGGRAASRMIILSAGILYYMVTWSYAGRLFLGWKILWYEILALGTGMFQWQAFLLSAAIVALGIRFLAIQSFSRRD